jgi:hypothetical protein
MHLENLFEIKVVPSPLNEMKPLWHVRCQFFFTEITLKNIDKTSISAACRVVVILDQYGRKFYMRTDSIHFHYAFTTGTSCEERIKSYFTLSPVKFRSEEFLTKHHTMQMCGRVEV